MKIELYTDLQSHVFEVDDATGDWIRAHLVGGKDFEIFFPEYEVTL